MNYLFFDIECSDGRHMCSFGYVLCDADFNVLKKEDILINPEAPFRLARYGGEPHIQLGYPKEKFYAAPNFVVRYEKIKRILERKGQLVIGHSVLNDVNFLQLACERYEKPCFEYSFFDEQQIYKTLNEGKPVGTALEKIAETYGIEPENLHRSDDDAKTTMEIVRRICKEQGMTPKQLADAYPLSKGKVENGVVKRFVTEPYKWYCSAVLEIGEKKRNENKPAEQSSGKRSRYVGKKICFATKLERTIPLKMYTLVQKLVALGAKYTDNPAECNIFIKHKSSKCYRYVYATQHKGISIIPFEQLLGDLGLKYDDVEPYPFKGDYVGKKREPVVTGVSHVESTPSSIGDRLKEKNKTPQKNNQKNNRKNRNFKKRKYKNAGAETRGEQKQPAIKEKNEGGTH
ncbi:MAG: 3'-5' exonuclease [Clostridia bacterium]|nr:3'-5' exonuclease [Clostridia bacterium]